VVRISADNRRALRHLDLKKLGAAFVLLLCPPAHAQQHQLEFTTGYNFQNSDQGSGVRSNFNGWFSALSFDLTPMLSINLEIDNYYGTIQGASAKQQNFVVGPQLTFRNDEARLRPLVYVEAGDQRSSSAAVIDHSFDLQAGGGVQVKLSDRFALQLVPAEYDLAAPTTGVTHSFTANAGICWTVWKGNH
jgi:outer membrane protein with beta-barrel domain